MSEQHEPAGSQHGTVSRRTFVAGTGAATAGAAAIGAGVLLGTSKTSWAGANERINVAVAGIRGRGKSHMSAFHGIRGVEITALCDVDERLFEPRIEEYFTKRGKDRPKTYVDYRELLEDETIDAVSLATPNHWHALGGIWACQAGKHAYIEKPCSHNVFEGRQLAEAAKKYGVVVQHGTQIRSNPGIIEAIQQLRGGVIGDVYMARGLCFRMRDSIGKKPDSEAPEGVHYGLFLGPAPSRAFSENRFHYNWHWHWDYGNGDIGNQGVHQMDVCRWGLGVGHPTHITSMGKMVLWDDDKEIPNVIQSSFDYPEQNKMIVFDTRPWITNDERGAEVGVIFYGSEGYMVIDSYERYRTYLGRDERRGPSRDEGGNHYQNFVDAIRGGDPQMVTAPIEEGHISSSMCHLGLISAKLGRAITLDPDKEQVIGDEEANKLLTRDYREPFVVPEVV